MKSESMKLFAVAAASLFAAVAIAALPANTCIVSGSIDRTPPASGDVAYSGGLDSTWRAVAAASVAAKFHPHKPVGLQMVIR